MLIQYLSRIQFDFGAVDLLADELARLGLRRPLLVTDAGVAAAGILQRVLDAAGAIRPVVYDGTSENPTEASLEACMTIWQAEGCDGVIALGGGSPIDLSKAVALIASHGGSFADYTMKAGGSESIGRVAPQIAIPTAAGTGAEIGRACVLKVHDGRKLVAVNLNMVADTVICDPELTLSLPPRLTAATGIDALSHGIETTLSPVDNPPAAAIALDCVRRASQWLPVAVEDGSNRQARWQMMMAALEGCMALQKGLGGAHAMANPLGEAGHHHGTLIGILLPHILRFNRPAAGDAMTEVANAMGLEGPDAVADGVAAIAAEIGLPGTLGAVGVTGGVLPDIADRAELEHLSRTNPRKATATDYLAMLEAAL